MCGNPAKVVSTLHFCVLESPDS